MQDNFFRAAENYSVFNSSEVQAEAGPGTIIVPRTGDAEGKLDPHFLELHRREVVLTELIAFSILMLAFLVQCAARLRVCRALSHDLRARSSSFSVSEVWYFNDREKIASFGLAACVLTIGAVLTSCDGAHWVICAPTRPSVGFALCCHAYFLVFCAFCSCARACGRAFQRAVNRGQQNFACWTSWVVIASLVLHFIGLESTVALMFWQEYWWPLGVYIAVSNVAYMALAGHLLHMFRVLSSLLGEMDETQSRDLGVWVRCNEQLRAWRHFVLGSSIVIFLIVASSSILLQQFYSGWSFDTRHPNDAHTPWTDRITLAVFGTLFSLLSLMLRYVWVPVCDVPPFTQDRYYTDRRGKLRFSLD